MSRRYPECPLQRHDTCKELHSPKLCALVRKDKKCLKKIRRPTKKRGLSGLQKKILLMAYTGKEFEVSTKEVLGLALMSRYKSAQSSVSMAFKRLEDMGLAERRYLHQASGKLVWSGVRLTNEGKETSKVLLNG